MLFRLASYLAILTVSAPLHSSAFRMVTYNLRYDSKPDNITPWSLRRLRVAEQLMSEGIILAGVVPEVFVEGFQEALVRQVHDLAELLGTDWGWIGIGRDDGIAAGEFSPIFFKKSEGRLISNDTFWTSNTPFDVSRFPGAGSFRICTIAYLQLKSGNRTAFTYLNTHRDDQADAQRQLAACIVRVSKLSRQTNLS
ncbi:hypothetical protein B0H16DRAFT_1683248 [Mycena metata]|uniref:Endonuclease/exonuclease/phosphatase domain-containing protein n=1 Tax=Mycena metata TaxID=1033252 RepID=A0AAD7NXG8_9AGAR|nr:hypothetical protein B0H16DRAFT_1683248 [Mycena metata]